MALATIDKEHRALCEKIDTLSLPTEGRAELRVAFNLSTGTARELPGNGQRDYSQATPDEVCATIDLLVPPGNGRRLYTVIDWKTTAWQVDLEACQLQLDFGALCVSRIFGLEEVACGVGEINAEGVLTWEKWVNGFEDLGSIANKVRSIIKRVRAAQSQADNPGPSGLATNKGAHCRYCPAWLHCPQTRAAIQLVMSLDASSAPIEEKDLGAMWLAIKAADRLADRVRPLLERAADKGPVRADATRVVKWRGGKGRPALVVAKG